MNRKQRIWSWIVLDGTIAFVLLGNAQTPLKSNLPDEVQNLVATAKGSWTSYGLSEKGEIVKRFSYPDELTTKDLKVEDARAFVSYTAKMHFPGREEPFVMEGKEGYYLNADGTLGDYFTEQFGQTTRYKKLSDGVWTASMPAFPQELEQFGFSNVISGTHVMVKVVSREETKETHRISRVTTVHWKDAAGKERWIQFTSLQGQHEVIFSRLTESASGRTDSNRLSTENR